MASRRERVVLELDDRFTTPMARAAVAAAVLDKNLDHLDGSNVRTSTGLRNLTRDVDAAGNAFRRNGADIDKFSGRLKLVAQAASVLGPALVPIGAVGIPALAGLASMAGVAALAGGSAVVAFQGVGTAVKALQAYKLEPTVANLEKAQLAMSQLGPDAARFVTEFQEFRPVLREIRDAAAEGWFPGLTESLEDFERLAPAVERIFKAVGQAGGDAVAAGAESLAGDRWEEAFSYLENEAPQVITNLAGIVGDLTHGLAEMMISLDPGSDAFTNWVRDIADGFDDWASSAQGREDIAAFLDYAAENGPKVEALFSSLVDTVAQVVQAAAPLGGPVLVGLTAVSDVIGAIADSDLGTPILIGVAALSAYNRALALTAGLQKSAFAGSTVGKGIAGQFTTTSTVAGQLRKDLSMLGPAYASAGTRSERLSAATSSLRGNLGGLGKEALRGAAPIAGLGLVMSGAADKIGLSNTASLALMGTFLGPWGAALGAGAGFVMDVTSASGDAADAIARWNDELDANVTSFSGQRGVLAGARAEFNAFRADVTSSNLGEQLGNWLDPDAYANAFEGLLGDSNIEEQSAALRAMRSEVDANASAMIQLGAAMNMPAREGGILSEVSDENALAILERAKPAMDALGISLASLNRAAAMENFGGGGVFGDMVSNEGRGRLEALTRTIAEQTALMDSGAGRVAAFGASVAGLSTDMLSTADSATAMSAALDTLLSPALDAEAATDAWRVSLQELRSELDSDAGFKGFSKAAVANRELTRSYVEGSKERLGRVSEVMSDRA